LSLSISPFFGSLRFILKRQKKFDFRSLWSFSDSMWCVSAVATVQTVRVRFEHSPRFAFENDRSRTRSDFDFVNKMRIFRPNPTRSLVGVTQLGAVTLRMVSGRFHFHPEAQLPALFRHLCRHAQSSLAAKRHVSYMI
jgi:hypothetical protein